MAETLPQSALDLLDGPAFAHVATVQADGSPQTTPVWIDRDGDVIVFNTAVGRAKHRNIERDPRVALSVHDPSNPYRYLQVRGRAEMTTEGADEHIDAMAKKYLGVDTYPMRTPDEQRIIVRITPEAVQYMAPRG